MNGEYRYVIGLMSGTSLDGLDIVYVKFNTSGVSKYHIIYSETVKYRQDLKQKLATGISKSKTELSLLNIEYGKFLGEKVNAFIEKFIIENVEFVASHGHTILHQPEKGITLQIGSGQVISNVTGLKVVSDFRTQDVQLGGQGAPLVPIGDELLFSEYAACLNLGGFANISYQKQNKRVAFDICPVNIVLNKYVSFFKVEYDDEGKHASRGEIDKDLLEKLNDLPFYKEEAPKSLGLEWVQVEVFPLIDSCNLNIYDVLRTFVEHIAIQIAEIVNEIDTVLVTGGGAFNLFLMQRIKTLSAAKVVIPEGQVVDYKEALIFAFLGVLRVDNQVNCLSSVTGASRDHSSGQICTPEK